MRANRRACPNAAAGCCGWAWAGFGGLQFNKGGDLVTPWGQGRWGAPPEAQSGDKPALLAEFAGFKHLLRVTLERGADGTVRLGRNMQSRRCSDNDPSSIHLTSGTPLDVK